MSRTVVSLLSAVLIAIGLPVIAEISVDDVRRNLDAGDFAKLEADFSQAHGEAIALGDFRQLRQVYSVLFVTANNARLAKTRQWQQEIPQSAYAATALVWSHYYRAFKMRGEAWVRDTSPEALAAFYEELDLARIHLDHALEQAEDFLPAIDAAILLQQTGAGDHEVQELVDRSLMLAPDRHSLSLGLSAVETKWGGRISDSLRLCASMADKVPGYDAELCLIETAFKNNLKGPAKARALKALDRRDEEFLDYARLDAYLNEWRDREDAADEAMRIHRAMLGPEVSISRYEWYLRRITSAFDLPFYGIEAHDALLVTLNERLSDNPQSPAILEALVSDAFEKASRSGTLDNPELVQSRWAEMLDLAAYQPNTWLLGENVNAFINGAWDIEEQSRYWYNAIYYSNHDAFQIKAYLTYLFSAYQVSNGEVGLPLNSKIDPVALGEQVLCPMYRVTRVYDFICEADQSSPGCNIGGWGADFSDRVRRLMKNSDECAEVRDATIEQLVYAPIPVAEFTKEFDH